MPSATNAIEWPPVNLCRRGTYLTVNIYHTFYIMVNRSNPLPNRHPLRLSANRLFDSDRVWMRLFRFMLIASVAASLQGCERSDADYFPLNEGRWWQYRVMVKTRDENKQYKYILANLPSRDLDSTKTFVRRTHDGSLFFYQKTDDGIFRVAVKRRTDREIRREASNQLIIPYPTEVGKSWGSETTTTILDRNIRAFERKQLTLVVPVMLQYTVESLDDIVSVPAGYFEHCLRIRGFGRTRVNPNVSVGVTDIEIEIIDWYAPGVGLVRAIRKEEASTADFDSGEYLFELESLN